MLCQTGGVGLPALPGGGLGQGLIAAREEIMPLPLGTWATNNDDNQLIIESDGSGGFKGTIFAQPFTGGFFNESTQLFTFLVRSSQGDFHQLQIFTGTLFKA